MTGLPDNKFWFRPDEVAEYLVLKRSKVWGMIRRRKLAAVKIENEYRISRAELERLMTQGTKQSKPE